MTSLQVIRPDGRRHEVASGLLRREAAISGAIVGAERMWFGYAELTPGAVSAVHHHGRSESGIYIISGTARFCAGARLDEVHEARAGDFVWVPPDLVHVEINASDDDSVRMAVTRSTQEAIVVNVAAPSGWQPPG